MSSARYPDADNDNCVQVEQSEDMCCQSAEVLPELSVATNELSQMSMEEAFDGEPRSPKRGVKFVDPEQEEDDAVVFLKDRELERTTLVHELEEKEREIERAAEAAWQQEVGSDDDCVELDDAADDEDTTHDEHERGDGDGEDDGDEDEDEDVDEDEGQAVDDFNTTSAVNQVCNEIGCGCIFVSRVLGDTIYARKHELKKSRN